MAGMVSWSGRQQNYRFRTINPVAGGLNDAFDGADPAQNADPSIDVDTIFRFRVSIEETAGGAANKTFSVRYQLNGAGGYQAIGAATPIQLAAVTGYADDDPTSNLLTGGTGAFLAGHGGNNTNTLPSSGNQSWSGNQESEYEIALLIDSAQVDNGDFFDLRIYESNGTALTTYTVTARVTAVEGAPPMSETLTTEITAITDLLDRTPVASRGVLMAELAPLAWWQLGDSGGTDKAGNHDLTWNGSPTFESTGSPIGGEDKGYVSLDRTLEQHATVANDDLGIRADMAYEVWVRADNPGLGGGDFSTVFSSYDTVQSNSVWLIVYDDANTRFAFGPTSFATGIVALPIDADDSGVWRHWVVNVHWGTNTRVIQVFHNGVHRFTRLDAHAAQANEYGYLPPGSAGTTMIGGSAQTTPAYLSGDLAEISFYDRVLRPSEVKDLFNAEYVPQSVAVDPATETEAAQVVDSDILVPDPADADVTIVGSTAELTWSASPTPGVVDYQVFRRTPQTGAPFDPETDTPIATGITDLFYDDEGLDPADYDWQVFGRVPT